MGGRVALFLLVILALMVMVKAGGVLDKRAVFAFGFVAALIGLTWLLSGFRHKSASKVEVVVATVYLVVRRVVGFTGALVFLVLAVRTVFFADAEMNLLIRIAYALSLLGLALLCGWVAVVGQGLERGNWRDDLKLHRENKRRYRWRW